MTGLTMTDCSVADNVTQAKYELDRADQIGDAAARQIRLGDWALKWGRAMLEVAAEHAGEDDGDTYDHVSDELTAAEQEIEDKISAINDAIKILESCL